MVGYNQHRSLAGDILSAPDLATGQEEEQYPYYYSANIIEPRHYSTPHKEEISNGQLYLTVRNEDKH